MPDIVFIDSGTDTPVSTDYVNIDGTYQHVQRIKLVNGAENGSEGIPGDATYGLDVDVRRIPNIILELQNNPFLDPIDISGNVSLIKDSALGVDVNVNNNIILANQPNPFLEPIDITGNVQLVKDSVDGIDVRVKNSITLASQNNPFLEAIDITGYVNLVKDSADGIDVRVKNNIVLAPQINPFIDAIDITGYVQLARDSTAYGIDVDVKRIPEIILATQANPFIDPIDVLITNEKAIIETGNILPINTEIKLIGGVDYSNNKAHPISVDDGGKITVSIPQSVSVTTQSETNLGISGRTKLVGDIIGAVNSEGQWEPIPISEGDVGITDVFGANAINVYIMNSGGGQVGFLGMGGVYNNTTLPLSVDSTGKLAVVLNDSTNNIGNVNVDNIPNIILANQPNPFIEAIDITGYVQLAKDDPTTGIDVAVKNNITLESQNSPFSTPIDVSGTITLSDDHKLITTTALTVSNRQMLNNSYGDATNIWRDFQLSQMQMNFSTVTPKDIIIYTSNGTTIWESTGDASEDIFIDFENISFDSTTNVTVSVGATNYACIMNMILVINYGNT